jgi:hypothetical protein
MLNGLPFSELPILFAGTIKLYSKSAIPQLISIAEIKPVYFNILVAQMAVPGNGHKGIGGYQ